MGGVRVHMHRGLLPGAAVMCLLTGWFTPQHAFAETVRRAVLFAHGDGGPGLAKLRYTKRDVQKIRDVLVDLGGFESNNLELVFDQDSATVLKRLASVEKQLKEDKAAGKQTMLLVYYSGHAKDGFLRLGKSKLDMALLRGLLEDSGADVRVAIIDACGAGELTREKGGRIAPPLVVRVDDALTARGQVIIASSSETESSQESDEIQGSFFTHHWVSGLRGEADRSSDGKVTLEEAYAFAYSKTVEATMHTRAGVQHPTYRYNLRGAGDVVMANLQSAGSMTLPEEMDGRFVVFDMERQLVVAEVDKTRGKPLRIALKGGTYAIKKRESDHLLMQRVKVGKQADVTVDPAQMQKVSFDSDYAKGELIELESLGPKHGIFGWSFSGGVGTQGFYDLTLNSGAGTPTNQIVTKPWVPEPLTSLFRRPAFPATTIGVAQVRYHGLFNKHFLLGGDLSLGLRDYEFKVNTGAMELPYTARFFMAELGFSPMWEQEFWFFRVAAGPRLSGLFTWRYILSDAPVKNQVYLNLAPGVVGYAGVDIFRFLHLELGFRGNLSLFAIDGFRAIGYGALTLAVHIDL